MILFFNFNSRVAPKRQDAILSKLNTSYLGIGGAERLAPVSEILVSRRICRIRIDLGFTTQCAVKLLSTMPEIKSISTGEKILYCCA